MSRDSKARKKNRKSSTGIRGLPPEAMLAVLLAVLVFDLFMPMLGTGFVYDSAEQIGNGEFIHHPENLPATLTFRVMSMDVLDFNRPVALVSFMLDSAVWHLMPFGYHLTSNLLHLIGTLLVFALVRHVLTRETGGDPARTNLAAFAAALLFAVHPVVTEAVCEPSNRKDLLAMIFGFGALLIAARHDPATRRGDLLRLFLVALLSLLSVGSKESGAAFPIILGLYWWIFRRAEPRRFWIVAIGASTAVTVAFLIARFVLEHRVSNVFVIRASYPGGSFANTFWLDPRIFVLYLENTFWPAQLCADYNAYSLRYLPLLLALPVLALVGAGLTWWGRHDRRALFAAGIMTAGILPAANLMPQYHPAADRYLYLPLAGAVLLVALALEKWRPFRRADHRWLTLIPILFIGAMLSRATLEREAVWANPVNLWEDTVAKNNHSEAGWHSLPNALRAAGRLSEAKARYEEAFRTPVGNWPWLWAGYAITLEQLGEHDQALAAARHAVALKPDIVDTRKMVLTLQGSAFFCNNLNFILHSAPSTPPKTP